MVTLDAPGQRLVAPEPRIRRYVAEDRGWVDELLRNAGAQMRIRRGAVVEPAKYAGYVYEHAGLGKGIITVRRSGRQLEVVAAAAELADPEILGQLIDVAVANAPDSCRRLWVVCHNAEFRLHQVLQRHRFRLCGVRPGAYDITRRRLNLLHLPAQAGGVDIRDELEFEFLPR